MLVASIGLEPRTAVQGPVTRWRMVGDAGYFARRASEEKAAAMKAIHPSARQAHLEIAERFQELARSISDHERALGLDLFSDGR